MHEQIKEMKQKDFTRGISDKVVEFTNWPSSGRRQEGWHRSAPASRSARKAKLLAIPPRLPKLQPPSGRMNSELVGEMFVTAAAAPCCCRQGVTPANNSPVDTLKSEAALAPCWKVWGKYVHLNPHPRLVRVPGGITSTRIIMKPAGRTHRLRQHRQLMR